MMIIEKKINNNECDSTWKLACAFAAIKGQVIEHSFSWFDCSSTRQKVGSILLLFSPQLIICFLVRIIRSAFCRSTLLDVIKIMEAFPKEAQAPDCNDM